MAKDKEHYSSSRLRTPADHLKRVKELREARWEHEREWRLNLAFYKGNQYAFFPKNSRKMMSLATDPTDIPRYRVRLVSNQIMPGVRSYVAKLTKSKPVIHAVPSVATDKAVRAARIAERLQEHWWRELDLAAKRYEAWTWSCIGGQGWWKIGYNFNAGKSFRYVLDPNGQPIVNSRLEELFTDMLMKEGLAPMEATVSLGEVSVETLSPHDVILDPTPSNYSECQYCYLVYRLSPDEVFARWGKRVAPNTSSKLVETLAPTTPISDDDTLEDDLVTVYVGIYLKSKALPDGNYVVFTEDCPDEFLYKSKWPYPFDELPLVKYPGIQIPGCVYDRAIVSDARPLQQELNRTISQIVEYKNLNIAPQWIAPAGSGLRNKITSEPGAVWVYNPTTVGGLAKPEPVQLPSIPPYVFEHVGFIIERIKEIFHMTRIAEGQTVPNVEAGVAIDLLQEMAIDQIEPQIHSGEMALSKAGTLLLRLAQEYYDEARVAKLLGSTVRVENFTKADIKDVDIFVEAGSGLPRTRAGRQLRIRNMIELGLIRPEQAWKYYDAADMKSISAKFAQDEDKAIRENDLIIRDIPINPVAMNNMIMAVEGGVNPFTQQPISSPQEIEVLLQEAAIAPLPSDNHVIELDVHGSLIKSEEFMALPPKAQNALLMHYQKHYDILQEQAKQQTTIPPRISYSIRGTAGPTASAKILGTGGVPVSPDELIEPPLETWVSDSIDKPDQDEAANDPLSQMDLLLSASKLQEQMARTEIMNKRAENEGKEEDKTGG